MSEPGRARAGQAAPRIRRPTLRRRPGAARPGWVPFATGADRGGV